MAWEIEDSANVLHYQRNEWVNGETDECNVPVWNQQVRTGEEMNGYDTEVNAEKGVA